MRQSEASLGRSGSIWKVQFCRNSQLFLSIPKYFHFTLQVALNPEYFPLMKCTSFSYYFSEKITSIDKTPAILQAFKVVISVSTTEHRGIWVRLLVTSSKDMAQNTQETFDWVSSAVKTYLGYLRFIFYQKWTRLLDERTVSSSNTIRSLAMINITQLVD